MRNSLYENAASSPVNSPNAAPTHAPCSSRRSSRGPNSGSRNLSLTLKALRYITTLEINERGSRCSTYIPL